MTEIDPPTEPTTETPVDDEQPEPKNDPVEEPEAETPAGSEPSDG